MCNENDFEEMQEQDRQMMLCEASQYYDEHGSDVEPPLKSFISYKANSVPVYRPGPICKPEEWFNYVKELVEQNKNV